MGVVYKARTRGCPRAVAIKILPHELCRRPGSQAPVRPGSQGGQRAESSWDRYVHDIADAGIDFIVMEYVGGKTLDQ